jgi:hypothetical protein
MTEQQVLERLRTAIDAAGGQRKFAEQHGFTPAYVHDVLYGKRALADRILAAIGVERLVVYRLKDQDFADIAQQIAHLSDQHEDGETGLGD